MSQAEVATLLDEFEDYEAYLLRHDITLSEFFAAMGWGQ